MNADIKIKYLVIVAIIAILLVGAFVIGMHYQKQQGITAEIISYSGDKMIDVQRLPIAPNRDSFEVFTDTPFVHENNITFYWIYLGFS